MRVTVRKWGNSAAVRIPAALVEAACLAVDQVVDLREENGCLVLAPIRPEPYDLANLLAGITPENLHPEADFGPAFGKEWR